MRMNVVSDEFTVACATLDDWAELKELCERIQGTRVEQIISAKPEEMQGFLINSLMVPQGVGLLLLRWHKMLIGVAGMMCIDAPKPGVIGVFVQTQKHGFIHSCYIDSYAYGSNGEYGVKVPAEAGKMMMAGIEQWARGRGAVWLYGNVRLDGRFAGLWRKHGLKPMHGTAGKSLIANSDIEELPGLELHQVVVGKELTDG